MNTKEPVEAKNFPILEAAIFDRGIKKKVIAEKLNISAKALSNKLSGKSTFTWDEVVTLKCVFFPDIAPERLMSRNNGKSA